MNSIPQFEYYYEELTRRAESGAWIFRGVSEAKYKLYTSAQREYLTRGLNVIYPNYKDYISTCLDRIKLFKNSFIYRHFQSQGIFVTDPFLLSLLQHYGVPTPLIDFSESLDTAIFFALYGLSHYGSDTDIDNYFSIYCVQKEEKSSLDYILNTSKLRRDAFTDSMEEKLNQKIDQSITGSLVSSTSWSNILFGWELILLPTPTSAQIQNFSPPSWSVTQHLVWSNPRILAQKGCFFLNSCKIGPSNNADPSITLEDAFIKNNYGKLICFDIHKSLADHIRSKINHKNLEKSLFPESGIMDIFHKELISNIYF